MIPTRICNSCLPLLAIAVLLAGPRSASAHAQLNAPNGGEALTGGSTFQIRWEPAVAMHDTLNWDLWYSTVSASASWISIVQDLPVGDLAVGSAHSFAWTVPNITDSTVWVRIRQENNADPDYEDFSAGSFSITAAAGLTGDYNDDDKVDAADYTVWRNAFGVPSAGLAADGNDNGQIDAGDYTAWKLHYGEPTGGGGAAIGVTLVAEPASGVLLLGLFFVNLLKRRRFRHTSN